MIRLIEEHDTMVTWRTSSYSTDGGNCVEIALDRPEVLVRDTKDREGGILTASAQTWRELLSRLR